MILILLSSIILLGYLGYILLKTKEIPNSISETYYNLNDNLKWIFRITLILTPALILPNWIEYSNDNIRFLIFLACSGMIFVGCSPELKIKQELKIHMVSAYISCGTAILWMILSKNILILIVWIILGALGYLWKRKIIWWIEIITLGSILTINLINSLL